MNRRTNAVLAVAALAGALIIARGRPADVVFGQRAPAFRLAGLAGQTVSLSDYHGKVVLLNFWASWCPTCREEFPVLDALYKKYRGEGFEIVAPSVDAEGRKAIMPFLAKAAPSFTVLLAGPKTAAAYGIRELPSSFLIGQDGVVLRRYVGGVAPARLENDILQQIQRRRP